MSRRHRFIPQMPVNAPAAARRARLGGYALAVMGALPLLLGGCVDTATTKAEPETPQQEETQLVWPAPPQQPRITFVRSVRSDKDLGDAENSGADKLKDALLGKKEEPSQGLIKPYGVHADRAGRIFVTDTALGKVLVFDFANKKFSVWGTEGAGALTKPFGVTSDTKGRIYVSDASRERVMVYDRTGSFLYAVGKEGELEQPVGVAVDEQRGRIYVADVKKHHIAVFEMEGGFVSAIGERGTASGQFNFPTNLAIDRTGKLYVSDSMNFRVQVLDPDGTVLRTIGQVGQTFGSFARPKGIAVDSDGNVYVVDAAFNNFQIFNPEGELALFVGSVGQKPGQFWLPAGMAIDGQDRIYVVDQANKRVQIFQYLKDGGQTNAGGEVVTNATPESETTTVQ